MLKKFLILILGIFLGGLGSCFAQASVKITNVSFDNSDNLIYLSMQKQQVASVDGVPIVSPQKVKLVKLSEPNRYYFDVEDAILTMPKKTWVLQNSKLQKVSVAQTNTNPNVVRVVIYSDEDLSNMFVMQVDSGLIVRYNIGIATNDYLSEFYRDNTSSNHDYCEKISYFDEAIIQLKNAEKDLVKKVDSNFNNAVNAVTNTASQSTQEKTNVINIPAQNLSVSNNYSRIKTKYYLNRLDIKQGNILISGVGSANIEKVKILTDPNRIVFDMPNTILNPNLRNNEYKIGETDSVRLGQFEQSKVRIVITTNDTSKYKPIFSQDMQGILFAHSDKLSNIKLFDKTTTLQKNEVKHAAGYDLLTLKFSAPVIQSIVRNYDKIELTVFNATPIPETVFAENIKDTMFKNLKVSKIESTDKFQAGQKIVIPVDKYDIVHAYESQTGNQLVLRIDAQTVIEKGKGKTVAPVTKIVNKIKGSVIVIDPGHGGVDVGATRNGVYEKDLNLIVSKKVEAILKEKGYKVELTRTNDINPTLQERCDFSNERKTIVFVSIHANASVSETPNGIETHYFHDQSFNLAETVQKHLISETKAQNRGTMKSMFYVINHTEAPAVLVEMGYISNDAERESMQSKIRQDKTAKAIADGIIEYLKGVK